MEDAEEGTCYYDAVVWALNSDVTRGMTETTFGPAVSCTRAQMVTFLYRYYET